VFVNPITPTRTLSVQQHKINSTGVLTLKLGRTGAFHPFQSVVSLNLLNFHVQALTFYFGIINGEAV
jgi:hypothetical protein